MVQLQKIGLGGGCHWCTEAVFQAVAGVEKVEQGYIASEGDTEAFSEAVIVHFDPEKASLEQLLYVHLRTHNATSNHSFREKYRSAVYYQDLSDAKAATKILENLQKNFDKELITQVLPLKKFRPSRESIRDYYKKNPDAPFCKRYIEPKLKLINNKSV